VPAALEVSSLSKHFGPVAVLEDVSLAIQGGEIHALVGENGAGKSTLVKILNGYHTADPGATLSIWGYEANTPEALQRMAVLHQEQGLFYGASVWENIGIRLGYGSPRFGWLNKRRVRGQVQEMCTGFGLELDPDAQVSELSQAERSIVAILRAVYEIRAQDGNQLLILDEPTAALPSAQIAVMVDFVRRLRAEGAGILYISHHISEVLGLADRITVLRSGRVVGSYDSNDLDSDRLLYLMLGDVPQAPVPREPGPGGDAETAGRPVLMVSELSGGQVREASLSVRSGEVVGVTGLAGMGHDELPYLISGALRRRSGSVTVGGQVLGRGFADALAAGLAFIPGDRSREGLWNGGSALENLSLPVLGSFGNRVRIDKRAERRTMQELMVEFGVHPPDALLPLHSFSGGNQQKILLAKWFQQDPRVVILQSPTQGVDAAGRRDVLALVRDRAAGGAAVLVCSSDAEELIEVCDRILIMRHGMVAGELQGGPQLSEGSITHACQAA
jgi:ribose transport system ATP-binding protein